MGTFKHITVAPLSMSVGAEIGGVDISQDLDDAVIAEIRQALLDHLVIFFRDQDLTEIERHKAFTRRFGDLFVHPNYNMGQDNPEIVYLTRMPGDRSAAGETWHADTTMMSNPPMGAILYALETPEYGGDTLFANQYMAYDTLSDGMKRMLEGMKAVHNDFKVAGPQAKKNAVRSSKVREDADWRMTENAHPVARTHPETGRKCLFVNGTYVSHLDGLSVEESAPLLSYLYDHSCRPEFTCRFRWRTGSVAFWDNRCVQHLAIHDNQNAVRRMQRTQIEGDRVR
jgi:taurine dioxygenase